MHVFARAPQQKVKQIYASAEGASEKNWRIFVKKYPKLLKIAPEIGPLEGFKTEKLTFPPRQKSGRGQHLKLTPLLPQTEI